MHHERVVEWTSELLKDAKIQLIVMLSTRLACAWDSSNTKLAGRALNLPAGISWTFSSLVSMLRGSFSYRILFHMCSLA